MHQIIFVLIGIMATGAGAQQGITYTEANDASGIIFVPIADTYLTYKEWRIVYYYDLKEYYDEIRMMKQFFGRLERICNNGKNKTDDLTDSCDMTLTHAANHLESIQRNRDIIGSYDSIPIRRTRAAINIVGSLANSLFGILDQEDAARYDAEIQKLKTNEKFATELLKQNTVITERIIKTVNATFFDVNRKLKELEATIEDLDNQTDSIKISTIFNMMSNTLTLIFIDHDQLNTEIRNILAHTLKGEITDIIPVNQLKHDLQHVESQLEKGEEIAINLENESIYHIFRAASIHSALRGNLILMELRIPILDSETYKLYRAIPIPTKTETEYAIILPNSNLFLANMARTKYVPITKDEFQDCRTINANKYVCKQYEPIFTEPENVCELILLSKPFTKQIPKSCTIQMVPAQNYYLPLDEMNKYYCVITTPVETQVLCKNGTVPLELTTSGILEIHENCRIQTENQTLRAHSVHRETGTEIITPKFNLAKLMRSESAVKRTKIDSTNIFLKDHDSGLEAIANDLYESRRKQDDLLKNISQDIEIKSIRWTLGGVTGIASLLTIGLTIFTIVKNYTTILTCLSCIPSCRKKTETDIEMQEHTYSRPGRRTQTPYRPRRTM